MTGRTYPKLNWWIVTAFPLWSGCLRMSERTWCAQVSRYPNRITGLSFPRLEYHPQSHRFNHIQRAN